MKKLLATMAILLALFSLSSCDEEEAHFVSIPDKYAIGDSASMFWGETPRLKSPNEYLEKMGAECLKNIAVNGFERFANENLPLKTDWLRCIETDDLIYTDSIYLGRCTLKTHSNYYGNGYDDNVYVLLCRENWDFPCMRIGNNDNMENLINSAYNECCVLSKWLNMFFSDYSAINSAIIYKVCVEDRMEMDDYIKKGQVFGAW